MSGLARVPVGLSGKVTITERTGRQVEIVGVTTLGDVSRAQLTQIGGTGVFVSALREALLGGVDGCVIFESVLASLRSAEGLALQQSAQ